jgi:hypothetical protein
MNGGIDNDRCLPPGKKQIPTALVGRLLARSRDQVHRPINRLQDDLEAD